MNKVQRHRLHLVRWLNYYKESRKHTLIIAWVNLRPHGKENQSCSSSLSYVSPFTIDHLKAGDCLIVLKPWFPQSPSDLTRTWLPTWKDTALYCLSTLSSRGNRRSLLPHLLTSKVLRLLLTCRHDLMSLEVFKRNVKKYTHKRQQQQANISESLTKFIKIFSTSVEN